MKNRLVDIGIQQEFENIKINCIATEREGKLMCDWP